MSSILFTMRDVRRLITSENHTLMNNVDTFYNELQNNTDFEDCFYENFLHIDVDKAMQLYWDTRGQNPNNVIWNAERQIRITAGKANHLRRMCFDYDGHVRAEKSIFNNFGGNSNTQYGLMYEKEVLKMFRKQNKGEGTVRWQCGLMVNVNAPWLGCSPDGFFKPYDLNQKPILLEVKCPQAGRYNSIDNLCSQLDYLQLDGNGEHYMLKKNTSYYAQIQLSLALFDLNMAFLLIFCETDYNFVQIPVYFDNKFVIGLLDDLCYGYAQHYLPVLAYNSDQLLISNMRC